ncbi:MAG: DNA internalization-related competence protein ComEC/Rec2 [Thermodesulfobacteriota bacterium]|nr:DNA internalization-related competence protein ComEC/Rec2 [Thermodesulfobacteriota bacterium]
MDFLKNNPFITIFLFYASGIITGEYYGRYLFIVILIFSAVLFFSLFKSSFAMEIKSHAILFLIFCMGIVLINRYKSPLLGPDHISQFNSNKRYCVEGVIIESPRIYPDKTRILLKAEKIHEKNNYIIVSGKLLLSAFGTYPRFQYGDRIRFISKLSLPKNFNNPGGFDYVRNLAHRKVYTLATVKSCELIVRVSKGNGNFIIEQIEAIRSNISDFFEKNITFPGNKIIKALILGEKWEIPVKLKDKFASLGIAHILAISGLHIGIIAYISYAFFYLTIGKFYSLYFIFNFKKLIAVLSFFPVCFYGALAGLRIPTLRALIMIGAFSLAIVTERQKAIYNILALAAFLITLFHPPSLFDISFQLSFSSVFFIIYCLNTFYFRGTEEEHSRKGTTDKVKLIVFISISALLGTAPITSYYFGKVYLLSPFCNLIFVPILCFLVIPASLCLLPFLILYPPFAKAGYYFVDKSLSFVVFLVNSLYNFLPFVEFDISTPRLWEIVIFYGIIFVLCNLYRFKKKILIASLCLFLIVGDIAFWQLKSKLSKDLIINFIDVGQGESILVEFPGGKNMLIDGGGFYFSDFDVGRFVVAPPLRYKKIKKIDYLVLTHSHADHLNGLLFISSHFPVGEFWYTGEESEEANYQKLLANLHDNDVKILIKDRTSPQIIIGGVEVEILHPANKNSKRKKFSSKSLINNNSLVMRLIYKNISVLLTGDIEKGAEYQLTASKVNLMANILKVPHHGSATSSSPAFLKKVRPEIGIISLRERRFSLPDRDVISRYNHLGVKLFRTDRSGMIRAIIEGETYEIKGYLED